ncbi:hypothetical protein MLD52_09300 [Puniceicoccaceae bacterium K14]|nr:hypothetical protein [Puniceicoccaceae bacterium K14]
MKNDDDEIFRKAAAEQRLYLIVFWVLLVQVAAVGLIFLLGYYEDLRIAIRWIVGVELGIGLVIYAYQNWKIPPSNRRR